MLSIKSHLKIWGILVIIIAAIVCLWFYFTPKYSVWAVYGDGIQPKRQRIYKSVNRQKVYEYYKYMNEHKEDGVMYYYFLDEEFGNTIIPF